jgi:hypothetical protein
MPEMLKSARFSAYLSLLRALYVLYRQGMHTDTHHISSVETGNHQSKFQPRSTKTTTTTHELIFTTTFFLCTHLQTDIPQHTRKLEAHKKTSPQIFRDSALFLFFLYAG